jgi:signal transduction histidine kinase
MRTAAGDVVPEDQLPQARLLRGEVLAGAASPDLLYDAPDGRTLTVQYAGSPLRDETGAVTGAVMVLRNVTDERRLEHERAEALARAQSRSAELEAVLGAMTDGVVVYDPAGLITYTNAAFRTLIAAEARPDYERLALAERAALARFRTPEGQGLPVDQLPQARVLRGEVLARGEASDLVCDTLDGRLLTLHVAGSPLRDAAGGITGAVLVCRDVTAERHLERANAEQAEQLDRLFEGIADGLIAYDAEGRIVRENPATRRLLGLGAAPPEYYQLPARERVAVFAARDAAGHPLAPEDWPLMRVLRGEATGVVVMDIQGRTLDGRDVEVTTSTAPLRDGEGRLVGVVSILHDQTEPKRLERENEAARARELALREVNERLDTFVSIAAHDLRHPVAVSKMAVELAQRQVLKAAAQVRQAPASQTPPFAQVEQALARTGRNLDRLGRLIFQLLDVPRIREGTLVLEHQLVHLVDLVRGSLDEQRLLNPARTLTLTLALPPPPAPRASATAEDGGGEAGADAEPDVVIEGDADRLGQVLTNFLTNALHYSSEDQPVEVTVRVVAQAAAEEIVGVGLASRGERDGTGRMARVEVRDHGSGIPLEEQATIWERFQRAHSAKEAGGGLGLGLYIVRMLVEQHGGQVGVDSEVGQGSTFWFTLPLVPSPVTAAPPAAPVLDVGQVSTSGGGDAEPEGAQDERAAP